MTPYTPGDYKKYVYAKGQCHVRRIEEIITALDGAHCFHPEDTNDLGYLLDDAAYYLWRAAFADDTAKPTPRRSGESPGPRRTQAPVTTTSASATTRATT